MKPTTESLPNRVAALYGAGNRPLMSGTEAQRRIRAICGSKAFQQYGFSGLRSSTLDHLEALLVFIASK